MAVPTLTNNGLLPPGIHVSTLEEVGEIFGGQNPNPQRQELWRKFLDFVENVRSIDLIRTIYIDGSFVTDKADPGDIDALLLLPTPILTHHEKSKELGRLLQSAKSQFNVDAYPYYPGKIEQGSGLDWLDFFQTLRVSDAQNRNLAPGARRGLLEVSI